MSVGAAGCVALADALPDGRRGTAGPFRFTDPIEIIVAARVAEVRAAIERAERCALDGRWVVGWVTYEAAPAFDAALQVRDADDTPLAWFAVFDAPHDGSVLATSQAVPVGWRADVPRAEYEAHVASTREGIARGDYYQVNHTLRLACGAPLDVLDLWTRLRSAQLDDGRVGRAVYVRAGECHVACATPELFFTRRGRTIVTRPMKGTAARGRWSAEDDARAAELARSEKERAENVMIVDLLRNDVGRIAEPGSVRVPALFALERYPTVWQLTSTVEATVRADVTLVDAFAALFPCGSVTGAPKVAAMRRIVDVEASPRGMYCGAVGVIAPGGDCDFGVAIRTAWSTNGGRTTRYGAGGAVTWDSEPAAEWHEAMLKARVLTAEPRPAFALLETMRLEDGAYPLLARHLARLASSARYFGFADPTDAARSELQRVAAEQRSARVRLTADRDGRVDVTHTPLPAAAEQSWRVRLARTPVSCNDVFLHHKTTHRAAYERARAESGAGVDDVLLWNADGELTETTIGNLVVRLDGAMWTPPRDCGLLAGTLREALLERGEVAERVLPTTVLARAEGLWLVNGVRGRVPLRVVE